MKVELPWPDRILSPNARAHYMKVAQAKSAYSATCFWLTKATIRDPIEDRRHLRITFHPPDRKRRDLDNMLASIKYGLDGFSRGLGVDDFEWSLTITRGQPAKPGAVIIEVTHGPDRQRPPGAETTETGARDSKGTCAHCGGEVPALRDLPEAWTE